MKIFHFDIAARLFLVSAIPILAVAACGSEAHEPTATTHSELGSCPAGQQPAGSGCAPCTLSTPASATASTITTLFGALSVSDACYTVANNLGTFNLSGGSPCGTPAISQLANYVKATPPKDVTPPTLQGSVPTCGSSICPSISYSAYPSVESLVMKWDTWQAGASSVEIDALVTAVINVHVSADPFVVNPTLTLTNLPVTITFGADASGLATVPASQVVIASPRAYGTVSNCGAFGWCNGLVLDNIGSAFQSSVQTKLASQLADGLNGEDNSSPFWFGLMQALANQTAFPSQLSDPEGQPLPTRNTSSAAGEPTSWTEVQFVGYSNSQVTADFTTSDLCYLDCAPKACAAGVCGAQSDGCGDTIQCTCGAGQVCESNSTCCTPLSTEEACITENRQCGTADDGCGGTVTCGPPCQCLTQAQACKGAVCGTASDQCHTTYSCGSCPRGETCANEGQGAVCVQSCPAGEMYCPGKGCTKPTSCG